MKLLAKANAIYDCVLGASMWFASSIFVGAMLIVCLDVVMRYFLNSPMIWAGEICEYILLGIAFLSAGWILKEEGHIKVELVLARLKPKNQALLNGITSILGAVVLLIITWYAFETTWDNFVRGVPIMKSLWLPKAPLLSIVTLGTCLLFIQFVRRSASYLTSWRELASQEQRS
ncbi:TRAP transporter small permease [Chloroflexota bacterium]